MRRHNHSPEGGPSRTEIIQPVVLRIRDEINTLVDESTLIYGLQNLDQTNLPPEQQADICIDSLS